MHKIQIYSFLIFTTIPFLFYAQQRNGLSTSVLCLNVENGLPSRNISAAIQDHKGMFWFATDNGLCVYNGLDVNIYNQHPSSDLQLPSPVISDVAEDKFGRLWVCTAKGLCVMSADRSYSWSSQALGIADSIFTKGNSFIELHPKGGFWFLAGTSLFHIEFDQIGARPKKLGKIPFSIYASKRMIASKKGELWILSNPTVAIWSPNGFKSFTYPVKGGIFEHETSMDGIYTAMLNVLGDSISLIGTKTQLSLFSINHQQKIWTAKLFTQELGQSLPAYQIFVKYISTLNTEQEPLYIKEIIQDRQKNYWFITNVGVYCVNNLDGKLFKTFDFLQDQSVRKIFQDKSGDIWFNTYLGLTILNQDSKKISFTRRPIGAWNVIQLDSSDYLIGYQLPFGLGHYRKRQDSLHLLKEYPFHGIFDMVKVGNQVWMINEESELLGLDLKTLKLIQKIPFLNASSQVISDILKSIELDENQNLWIGGIGGLFFLQRQSNGLYQKHSQIIPKSLRNKTINTLYLDQKDQLWIGTKTEGLIKYNLRTKAIQYYYLNEGLSHPTVFSIQGSNRDRLIWVGTLNGLSCLDVKTKQFFNFYEKNGLPGNEFNTTAHLLDKNGILYMGGTRGVAYIDPRALNLYPLVNIQPYLELSMGNSKRYQPKKFYPEHRAVVRIPQNLAYTELRFFNSDASPVAALSDYRYKIKGLSKDWRFVKSSERILLSNLKSGVYHFELSVQVKGHWSRPYLLTLVVPALWYQTWWFILLSVLIFMALIYFLYRIRIAQIRKAYKMRKQLSEDLHDDLGTRIYALKSLAFQITRAEARQYKLDELLINFEALSKETLLVIRNFIWAFDPKNDQLQDLVQRMEKFVITAIKPIVPEIQFVTFSTFGGLKMKPGTKYHGLRVFQELLTNMVKHTNSKSILIDFQTDDHFLLITIQNTYSTLKEKEPLEEHYGQESLEHRINEVGGQLLWQDEHNCQNFNIRLPFE